MAKKSKNDAQKMHTFMQAVLSDDVSTCDIFLTHYKKHLDSNDIHLAIVNSVEQGCAVMPMYFYRKQHIRYDELLMFSCVSKREDIVDQLLKEDQHLKKVNISLMAACAFTNNMDLLKHLIAVADEQPSFWTPQPLQRGHRYKSFPMPHHDPLKMIDNKNNAVDWLNIMLGHQDNHEHKSLEHENLLNHILRSIAQQTSKEPSEQNLLAQFIQTPYIKKVETHQWVRTFVQCLENARYFDHVVGTLRPHIDMDAVFDQAIKEHKKIFRNVCAHIVHHVSDQVIVDNEQYVKQAQEHDENLGTHMLQRILKHHTQTSSDNSSSKIRKM